MEWSPKGNWVISILSVLEAALAYLRDLECFISKIWYGHCYVMCRNVHAEQNDQVLKSLHIGKAMVAHHVKRQAAIFFLYSTTWSKTKFEETTLTCERWRQCEKRCNIACKNHSKLWTLCNNCIGSWTASVFPRTKRTTMARWTNHLRFVFVLNVEFSLDRFLKLDSICNL